MPLLDENWKLLLNLLPMGWEQQAILQWRLGTVTRLRHHFGSVTHAVAACGERLLATGNGGAGKSGGHCGGLRCGFDETLAEG